MRFFLLAAMTVLPGSWLTFGISLDELNWRTRLALGIALSPIVLAVQLYLLRALHFDFAPAFPIARQEVMREGETENDGEGA